MKYLLCGGYTDSKKEGVGIYSFNEQVHTISGIENPSYMAFDKKRNLLFSVEELENSDKTYGGRLVIIKIDSKDITKSSLLTRIELNTAAPCYVSIQPEHRLVFVANYSSSDVSILHYSDDGVKIKPVGLVKHHGSSANPDRQEAPHPHCVEPVNDNKFIVSDLGLDLLRCYQYTWNGSVFKIGASHDLHVAPGAGPRHCRINAANGFLYVVNELHNTIDVFSGECACIEQISIADTVRSLPSDFKDESYAGELCFSEDDQYCYVSNRLHDSIVQYVVDEDGRLIKPHWVDAGGTFPRHISISGNQLYASNQLSDSITVFNIDENGRLQNSNKVIQFNKPCFTICINI